MCSSAAGSALQVLGVGANIAGNRLQAKAAQQAAAYAQIVAQNNKILAEYKAKDAEQRGDLAKQDLARGISRLKGQGRTGFAAGNVAIGQGSALDWERDLAAESTIERLKIDRNTEMEVWGIRNEDTGQDQANMLSVQAKAAASTSRISTVGSLLSLGSQFAVSFAPQATNNTKDWSVKAVEKGASVAAQKATSAAAKMAAQKATSAAAKMAAKKLRS